MKRRDFLRVAGTSAVVSGIVATSPGKAVQSLTQPKIATRFASPKDTLSGIEPYDDQLWLSFNHSYEDGDHYIVSNEGITQETFSFQNGNYGVTGLAVHPDRIDFIGYEGTDNRQPRLFKVNKQRGLETRLQLQINPPADATAVDSYTWIATFNTDGRIQQLDSAGNIRQSIVPRPDSDERIVGLAHDGENFWGAYQDRIVEFDSEGTILSEYAYPRGDIGEFGCGYGFCSPSLGHDGDLVWLGRTDKGNIVGLNTEIDTPTPTASPEPQTTQSQMTQSQTEGIQDSDGDGVPDDEDYAPNDPEVQNKEDVAGNNPVSDVAGPGFGVGTALTSVAGAGYLLKQRLTNDRGE